MSNFRATERCRVFATLFLLLSSSGLFSQTKTLNRVYEPVVVAAEKLRPLLNESISVFTGYSYNAATGAFSAIPLQIDEVTDDGDFLRETDGLVDSSDQIVFMPGDTGDRAPTNKWLNDSGAQQGTRIELEVSDSLAPDGKGWIYLYRNVAATPTVPSYVTYDRGPSTTAGTDTVVGKSYVEAHDQIGWFTNTSILAAEGGDGRNILDRQKVRVGGVFAIFTVTLNEQDNLRFIDVRFGGGPVRGLRELAVDIIFSGSSIDTARFVTQYFPYSTLFGAEEAKIPEVQGLSVREIRQSVDFNERAIGMKFFNAFNRSGITVNGMVDTPTSTITDPPDGLNWFMVTGNPGTFVVLMNVPLLGAQRQLYYKDDASVVSDDTGDKKSYGDSGLRITSSTSITGSFSFDFTTYYLGKNQIVDVGDQFRQRALNPLQVKAEEQSNTTAVHDDRGRPASFGLDDAQPNPFWPLRGTVRLSFKLGQAVSAPSLRIFNLLGQEVARFDFKNSQIAGNGGAQHILWDGRGANGQLLPAGVYFYQLRAGAQVATKKLIIIR